MQHKKQMNFCPDYPFISFSYQSFKRHEWKLAACVRDPRISVSAARPLANPEVMHLIYLWFPVVPILPGKERRPQIRVCCDIVHLGPEGPDIAFLLISSLQFCALPLIRCEPASPAFPESTVLALLVHFHSSMRAVKATVWTYTDCATYLKTSEHKWTLDKFWSSQWVFWCYLKANWGIEADRTNRQAISFLSFCKK